MRRGSGRDKLGRFKNNHKIRVGIKHSEEAIKNISEGHKGQVPWMKGKKHSLKSKIKMSKSLKGKLSLDKNPAWKGGKVISSNGYVKIKNINIKSKDGRFIYETEHRIVVEKIIGRKLSSIEHVHHINKIKTDNRPKNLMLFINNSAHKRFERWGFVEKEGILFDGRKYSKINLDSTAEAN